MFLRENKKLWLTHKKSSTTEILLIYIVYLKGQEPRRINNYKVSEKIRENMAILRVQL